MGEEPSFKNCKLENFAKCTESPQTKHKESGMESNL